MGKEQYFIITTLIVGIVTALPKDHIVFMDKSNIPSKTFVEESSFASKLPSQATCGKRKAPSFRIMGGSDSELGAWPWMVALGYKDVNNINSSIEWLCSGTLISNTHVLTGSTCFKNPESMKLTVARLGELNLDPTIDDGATPLDVPIERVIQHEEYNTPRFANDIGLIVLKNKVNFNTFIQPICLPLSPDMKNIDMGDSLPFVAGWGTTESSGPRSSSLKEIQIPITNMTECKKLYESLKFSIDDRVICAGEKGKDTCQGDSGGPLMWLKEKQFYLMGIVSFGKKCGVSPAVYTNVASYTDWILKNI
ncbi:venom protease-like [Aphis gossypii]|uniref:limulus clotting factor C n=1 Tax=Aphis gossypii TaxID=80765 RepID=A0A9P0NU02_APHGO|nr:venom protease-like [Aphis gossypii]CAH1738371.1 unnamed protein product [Aphis gossypii]